MSIYASAIVSTVDALTGASADAAYEAAYGKVYSQMAQMHNAARARTAAEANINAIRQDKVNTDKFIRMQQDKAEAMAKVAAAVEGTTGGSVRDTINQTEINSSLAVANNQKKATQRMEQQLSAIYTAQSTMLAVDDPKLEVINPWMNVANNMASISGKEISQGVETVGGWFGGGGGDTSPTD